MTSAACELPQDARTYRGFIRALKLQQPCARLDERGRVRLCGNCDCRRVLDVIAAYPVAENVHRDESSHELLTDFRENLDDEEVDRNASGLAVKLSNQRLYSEWASSALES